MYLFIYDYNLLDSLTKHLNHKIKSLKIYIYFQYSSQNIIFKVFKKIGIKRNADYTNICHMTAFQHIMVILSVCYAICNPFVLY